VLLVIASFWTAPQQPPAARQLPPGSYRVERVVDGDTIIVEPHAIIRLIGVDTPETVKPEHPVEPFGPEATHFTRQFLSGGTARLEFDHERHDRFGRSLAYVWSGERMLNEELLRAGLARFEKHFDYSPANKRRFRQAEQEARAARIGIWSAPK
jgi:micrococcal nuclease